MPCKVLTAGLSLLIIVFRAAAKRLVWTRGKSAVIVLMRSQYPSATTSEAKRNRIVNSV